MINNINYSGQFNLEVVSKLNDKLDKLKKDDMTYNIEIEQIEFNREIFEDIATKIRIHENNIDGLLTVQFSTAYTRIFNIIEILRKNNFSEDEILEKLELIQNEFRYIENESVCKYKKKFIGYIKDDSNLHLISNLQKCVDYLIYMFNNQKVDN